MNNTTPKIEAHLKGHDEPEFYAIFHDGEPVGNLDPDAPVDSLIEAASRGVGPTAPSFEWTRTLVVLFNQVAQVEAERAAVRDDGTSNDTELF